MKPKLLMNEDMHENAKKILEDVCELTASPNDGWFAVYTGLKPVSTNKPVFCPCTGIEHIQAPEIIYLDDVWKMNEGLEITSTAEHTWSLILQLAKMKRMQLFTKKLGIIGFGRIGHQIIRHAHAFGMSITVMDINPYTNPYILYGNNKVLYGLDVAYSHLECLLKESDVITLHVPLNDSTRGMIGKKEFDMMKDGALLINTSRQEVVNINDLKSAILSKNIYYADDFKDNVDLFDYHANVMQTRHIGGNCLEAREATDIYIANKIKQYIKESVICTL